MPRLTLYRWGSRVISYEQVCAIAAEVHLTPDEFLRESTWEPGQRSRKRRKAKVASNGQTPAQEVSPCLP